MTIENDNPREALLARLMVQYDELLAAERPAAVFDDSAVRRDTDLSREWQETKDCLELLHRANHRAIPRPTDETLAAVEKQAGQPDDAPPRQIGRFLIERELGRGGMGVVFLALDPKINRNVAIKIPRFEALLSAELRRRFLREAEAAARLSHPHLVTLLEVGEDHAICYLASEFCSGPNLAQWLQGRSSPAPVDQAARIVMQLAEGVQHAHSRGVLHRDVKPSNVLLQPTSGVVSDDPLAEESTFIPKLTDFGMAKLLESAGDETRSGAFIGTAAYMAPEQAEGRVSELDARTDVYALGVILYEVLTGAPPFRGKTEVDTLRQLVLNEAAPPRRIRRDLPRDLEAIVLKCLSKQPDGRYATAHELAADLRRFLSRQPTVARPLAWWQTAGKWAARRPMAAALTAVCLLALVTVAAAGVLYTLQVRRHAEELGNLLASRDEARAEAQQRASETAQSYNSDLRLAHQAWKEGRIADAKALLAKHQPHGAEQDRRSYPWHFLWRLTHLETATLTGHKGPVYVCRYSPDGRLLATAGEDGVLRLWNPTSGTLERSWQAHPAGINGIAFSPDGKWLATMSEDRSAAVWEVDTGKQVEVHPSFKDSIWAVVFSPDGQTLFAGGADGKILALNTADWSIRATHSGPPAPIALLAISPDGSMLATAGEVPVIRLWSATDMQPIGTLEGHKRDITALAFSHNGRWLASTSRDSTVKLWDSQSHDLACTYEGKAGYLLDVAFTADDAQLLVASGTGGAQIWELAVDKMARVLKIGTAHVYSVAASPDGRQVVTVGADEQVRLWQGSANPERTSLIVNTPGRRVALSPDGRIAVGDHLGKIRFYDSMSGELLKCLDAHEESVDGICFSSRGDLLAAAFGDNTIRLWRYPELTPSHTLERHPKRIWSIKFSPDGKLLATCGNDWSLFLWNTASGKLQQDVLTKDDTIRDVAFSPDGQSLAGGGRHGVLRLWRLSDGQETATRNEHAGEILSVAWSPDGKLLATGSKDDRIGLWNMPGGALAGQISPSQGVIDSVAFSPDGKTLASCGTNRTIKLWDVASQEQILLLEGHRSAVSQVIFSPQGDFLLSLAPGNPCELFLWPTRNVPRAPGNVGKLPTSE
ncbi:MAG TPA: serine/threonine-protein kinase [Pirellulales bacterium]|jgi:WD40 repeat protein